MSSYAIFINKNINWIEWAYSSKTHPYGHINEQLFHLDTLDLKDVLYSMTSKRNDSL